MKEQNYRSFHHFTCEYYPCHTISDDLNCLFCYCPLYFIQCPGRYVLLPDGNKDCSLCTVPHEKEGWETVQLWLKKNLVKGS